MAKQKRSEVLRTVQLGYLQEHLREVEERGKAWGEELRAPDPFAAYASGRLSGEGIAFTPDSERDPEQNHLLRHHFRSRTLWRRHTEWEGALRALEALEWRIGSEVDAAYRSHLEGIGTGLAPTPAYPYLALRDAFGSALGAVKTCSYSPHVPSGVVSDGRVIEERAQGKQVAVVEQAHRAFTAELRDGAKHPLLVRDLAEAAVVWKDLQAHEKRMRDLVHVMLRSRDFLHPCRFCKHLWES